MPPPKPAAPPPHTVVELPVIAAKQRIWMRKGNYAERGPGTFRNQCGAGTKLGSEAIRNGWRAGAGSSFSGDPLNLSPVAQMEGMCAFGQGQIEWTEQRTGAGLEQGSKILTNADSTGTFSRHPGGNRNARKRVSSSRSLSKSPLLPLSAFTVIRFRWTTLRNQDQET